MELTGLGEAELQGVVQVARAKAAQVVVDQLEPLWGLGQLGSQRGEGWCFRVFCLLFCVCRFSVLVPRNEGGLKELR